MSRLLKEYIELLLEKQNKGIDRIKESVQTLFFYNKREENSCKILVEEIGNMINVKYVDTSFVPGQKIYGYVNIDWIYSGSGQKTFNNKSIWQTTSSSSERSWGPLLYEVALEYVSSKGGMLMSDRLTVSDDAERVWVYYLRRSQSESNLEYIQMDYESIFGTPGELGIKGVSDDIVVPKYTKDDPSDDIEQISTFKNVLKRSGEESLSDGWLKSSLSKAYYKTNNDVIPILEELKLIEMVKQ
jgi:hypothetical protein